MPTHTLARDIMSSPVTAFAPGDDLLEAARTLFDNRWQGAPVVDGGRVVGVLTLGDVIALERSVHTPQPFVLLDALIFLGLKRFNAEMKKVSAMTVGEAMADPAVVIGPDMSVSDVAALMFDERLPTLPVVEDGRLVGIVGRRDIVRLILRRRANPQP
jgi:CBS domain-containing protein